ncbi:MAG: MBL fold metallo-hydrolase [Desulfobacterales bacterium]|nr:MBL fold metallo-hydrolase [Desulfobacterales bacterium]
MRRPHTRITILGSGTCVPSLARSACAVLVETGEAKILLDVGPGTMHRLLKAGLRVFEISHLFLSHFHPDHTGELVSFLFANKYPEKVLRSGPLTLVAGKGIHTFFNGLRAVYGEWIELPSPFFDILSMDTAGANSIQFQGIRVDSMPVDHRPESLAYRITGVDGRSVVYSGDTDMSENLINLARNADVLICEAALPDALKTPGHLTPSLAGSIAARAGVKQLVLTHFYPECDRADMLGQCRKTYDGPVALAKDLMRL